MSYNKGKNSLVIRDEDATNPIAVRFEHVTKTYKLYKNDRQRLTSALSSRVKCATVNASNDLSFEVKRGDAFALLGDNGAGKSTALKMITGVCFPTSGTIEVHGRVGALLELGAGFDMRLTGRENIHMRCQIWGLSPEETKALEPGIIEFSELGQYIDQPMRTYSSGMRARLGFAVTSSIKPDILVVDEALAVGDRKFSAKCRRRVQSIIRDDNVTVLFVTHSLNLARSFCNNGVVMDHGTVIFSGTIDEAADFYMNKDDEDMKKEAAEAQKKREAAFVARVQEVASEGKLQEVLDAQIAKDEQGHAESVSGVEDLPPEDGSVPEKQ